MHRWDLEITLKSGVVKQCFYRSRENDMYDVMKKLFDGKGDSYFIDLCERNEKSMLYIRVGDIAAIEIHGKGVEL